MDTMGKELVPFDTLTAEDIVLIPAFGTTLEMEARLKAIGLQTEPYNTTCPFVEKVWNRAAQIAQKDYTIIIHGKPQHEETRATFSHAASNAPSVIVNDMEETKLLAQFITGEKPAAAFYTLFNGRYSAGFDVTQDLQRIGVVNQTTQLASDTQEIAEYLKQVMIEKYGLTPGNTGERFADTRDTLCYATNDNQTAVRSLVETAADLAIVVGGYNSSNTTHLVELCETLLPTYFISSVEKISSETLIHHFDFHTKQELQTANWLPEQRPLRVLLTSGASCPDAMVEAVIVKLRSYFPEAQSMETITTLFTA
jgi:4-hydroxy-3-methylbut-2-enyl diphosphate reductase